MKKSFLEKTIGHLNTNKTSHNEFNFSLFSGFFKLFLSIAKHYKNEIVKIKLFSLLSSFMTFIIFILSGYLFSHLYEIDQDSLVILFFVLVILIICASLFTYLSEIKIKLISIKASSGIMPFTWKHILSLPLTSLSAFNSTEIVKMLSDYEASLATAISSLLSMASSLILVLMLVVFMFYCDPALSLLFLIIYLSLALLKLIIFPTYMRHTHTHLALQGCASAFLNESLLQIHKIRSAAAENRIHKKWLALLLQSKLNFEKATLIEIKISLIELIIPATLLLTLYTYFYFITYTINTFIMLEFLICAGQLTITFEKLSTQLVGMANTLTGLNRLAPLLRATPECRLATINKPFHGNIEFKQVSLKLNDKYILQDIDITLTPGSFTAFTGPSGAGKSSIFKLILGLTTPTSGQILIDHVNMKDIDIRTYRKQFGVVLQTTNIFPGTIFSNIAANTKITTDEAWELVKHVGLEAEVNAMPMKMFTHLSDNPGDSISGGQKQKILIARALATKPKILLLDEATSALDNTSQAFIFNYLKSLNITLIVIAHRHSTIKNADMIYCIRDGRITYKNSAHKIL